MNLFPKLLLIINLIHSISGLNQDFTSKFIVNAKRNAEKVSETTSSKISKLRLILLGDVNNQNEIVRTKKENCFVMNLSLCFGTKSRERMKKQEKCSRKYAGVKIEKSFEKLF